MSECERSCVDSSFMMKSLISWRLAHSEKADLHLVLGIVLRLVELLGDDKLRDVHLVLQHATCHTPQPPLVEHKTRFAYLQQRRDSVLDVVLFLLRVPFLRKCGIFRIRRWVFGNRNSVRIQTTRLRDKRCTEQ